MTPTLVAATFTLLLGGCATSADRNKVDPKFLAEFLTPPRVEARNLEAIQLQPQPPLQEEEKARITGLINNLAKIDSPDFGLSPTMSGEAFAPIKGSEQANAFMITDHHIKPSNDFAELVKLGPKALPFLLKALDDPTPTKLVITHNFGFGGMWFANELRGNPANEAEQKILATTSKHADDLSGEEIGTYTVKVGDVCFVIIGQIVGRSYEAVRYQPSACIVINSPTHDPKMAAQVRAIWSSDDPAQHLLDSLLLDFASRGVPHDTSSKGWDVASSLQTGAAMRLLYYYPQQTTNMIAARLHGLSVSNADKSIDLLIREQTRNEVRNDEFVKAVAWSHEPAIQAEIRRLFEASSDPDIVSAAVAGMDPADAPAFRKHIEDLISQLPETEPGPYGDGYNLLLTLGENFGAGARPAYERYMEQASLQRKSSMCLVLADVHGDWSVNLLGPLLKDTRPVDGWDYAVVSGQDEPRLPIRVCDEAAQTIADSFPKLSFKMAGRHSDLDRQIGKMRDQIAQHDY